MTQTNFKVGDKIRINAPGETWHHGKFGVVKRVSNAGGYSVRVGESGAEAYLYNHEAQAAPKFEVGDRVDLRENRYSSARTAPGNRVVVKAASAYSEERGEWYLSCDFPDGYLLGFWESELKPSRPRVDDRVKVIDGYRKGDTATLVEDDHTTLPFRVMFDDGEYEWVFQDYIEVTDPEPETKFKVNDRVKVSLPGRSFYGYVKGINENGKYQYNVVEDGQDETHYIAVYEREMEAEEIIEDGSMVTIDGEQGIVAGRVGSNPPVYRVRFGSDKNLPTRGLQRYRRGEIEAVAAPFADWELDLLDFWKDSGPAPGDIVRVKLTGAGWHKQWMKDHILAGVGDVVEAKFRDGQIVDILSRKGDSNSGANPIGDLVKTGPGLWTVEITDEPVTPVPPTPVEYEPGSAWTSKNKVGRGYERLVYLGDGKWIFTAAEGSWITLNDKRGRSIAEDIHYNWRKDL